MFIPGYFGRLECPASREFCKMETITGIKFKEGNRFAELIMWAIFGGITALPLFLLCVPCLHTKIANSCKRMCGVNKFRQTNEDGVPVASRYDSLPNKNYQRVLRVVNAFFMVLSIVIIGIVSWWLDNGTINAHTVLPIMLVSIWGVIIATFGLMSASEPTPARSCILLTYFFLQLFVTLISFWASLSYLASDDISTTVERNWDLICNAFKSRCTPQADEETQEEEMEEFTDFVQDWVYAIGAVVLTWILMNSIALFAAYRLIGGKTLTATSLTTVNNVNLVLAVLLTAAGIYFSVVTEMNADIGYVSGLFLASAAFMIVNSPLGLFAARKPHIGLLWVHFALTCCYILLLIAASVAIFVATDKVDKQIDGFSEDRLAEVADAMQLAMSEDDMKIFIKENVRRMGIAIVVLAILQILLALAILSFIRYTKVSPMLCKFDLFLIKVISSFLVARSLSNDNWLGKTRRDKKR